MRHLWQAILVQGDPWPVSPWYPPIFAAPLKHWLQVCTITPSLSVGSGSKLRQLWLRNRYFTDWAISWATSPDLVLGKHLRSQSLGPRFVVTAWEEGVIRNQQDWVKEAVELWQQGSYCVRIACQRCPVLDTTRGHQNQKGRESAVQKSKSADGTLNFRRKIKFSFHRWKQHCRILTTDSEFLQMSHQHVQE